MVDAAVGVDAATVVGALRRLLPDETHVSVGVAADSLALSGTVPDAVAAGHAPAIAAGGGDIAADALAREPVLMSIKKPACAGSVCIGSGSAPDQIFSRKV